MLLFFSPFDSISSLISSFIWIFKIDLLWVLCSSSLFSSIWAFRWLFVSSSPLCCLPLFALPLFICLFSPRGRSDSILGSVCSVIEDKFIWLTREDIKGKPEPYVFFSSTKTIFGLIFLRTKVRKTRQNRFRHKKCVYGKITPPIYHSKNCHMFSDLCHRWPPETEEVSHVLGCDTFSVTS